MMMHGWYGSGWMQGDYWWMGLIAMIIHILFWVGIIYLAYRLISSLTKPNHDGRMGDNSLFILKERYSKGEIDLEEYKTRKQELEN